MLERGRQRVDHFEETKEPWFSSWPLGSTTKAFLSFPGCTVGATHQSNLYLIICGLHPPSEWNRFSARERIGREDWVVKDHGLGLATEQADFQLVPELGRVRAGLTVSQPVEPAAGLVAMTQAAVGHRQERPTGSLLAPSLNRLLQPMDRLFASAGGGTAAPSVRKAKALWRSSLAATPASRTGSPGSTGASGAIVQAQATTLAVPGLIVPPKRSSTAAVDCCQTARSPDASRTTPK